MADPPQDQADRIAAPAPGASRLHYGSLESQAAAIASAADVRSQTRGATNAPGSLLPLSEHTQAVRSATATREGAVAQIRRAHDLVVPTDDAAVRRRLKELGEPRVLFGETLASRRDRLKLKALTLRPGSEAALKFAAGAERDLARERRRAERAAEAAKPAELVYSVGSDELQAARRAIAEFSLPRAKARLEAARAEPPVTVADHEAAWDEVHESLSKFSFDASVLGDDRPVVACAYAPSATHVATASWSGLTKVWSLDTFKTVSTLRGHTERVAGVAWHPGAYASQMSSAVNLATCSADRTARLWSLDQSTPIATLRGHADRLARVAFHPSGAYIGTTSFDCSWRLWDVETESELLLQDGHSRACYAISFQDDGALVATAGLDAHARLWDLRSGKCILVLRGHVKPVLALDFSPNGYVLASGGKDNSVRIWDLRKRASTYTIPAHSGLVSCIRFNPAGGKSLMTASYDNTVKCWSAKDWRLVTALRGHEDKVAAIDLAPDGSSAVSASFDRTWKFWTKSDGDVY